MTSAFPYRRDVGATRGSPAPGTGTVPKKFVSTRIVGRYPRPQAPAAAGVKSWLPTDRGADARARVGRTGADPAVVYGDHVGVPEDVVESPAGDDVVTTGRQA